jgi:hypothetical protein
MFNGNDQPNRHFTGIPGRNAKGRVTDRSHDKDTGGLEAAKVLEHEKVLACGHCGRKVTVSLNHEWGAELDATFYLPCTCFDKTPEAVSTLTPHRVQFVVGEKMRELVNARDAVHLAAVSVTCNRGHIHKDTALQEAQFTYQGECRDCGPGPVLLHATLKRKA